MTSPTCVFCNIVNGSAEARVVFEDPQSLAFLDRNPQSRGHLQLIPKTHYRWIYELPDMGGLFTTAQRIIRAIIPVLGADHVIVGSFGREIMHAHIWIVPQYGQGNRITEGTRVRGRGARDDVATLLRTAIKKEVFG